MGFLRALSIASVAAVLLLVPAPVRAEPPEYQVKAAILYKFAVFVEWPAQAFATASSPFVACVLGQDPFGKWLQHEMGEARVGSHPVAIRKIEPGEAAGECHLAFIAASEAPRLQQIITPLRDSKALIVSDISDVSAFCRSGGMICLVTERGKVRFHINTKAMERAGLKIDSRLKRVALSAECGEAK